MTREEQTPQTHVPTRDHLRVFVNGRLHRVRGEDAFLPLSEYLRRRLGLSGTKIVCSEGDCGACTVVVGRPHGEPLDRLHYRSVDSCIQFMYQVDSCHVVTVEGLSGPELPTPLQQSMVDHFASQCGFCTPGIVMSLVELLEGEERADDELRTSLSGNLCRCTGYVQIFEAFEGLSRQAQPRLRELFPEEDLLGELVPSGTEEILIEAGDHVLYVPTALERAARFKASHRETTVVNGATDIGVLYNKGRIDPRVVLLLNRVQGLDELRLADGALIAGAGATWSSVRELARELVPELHRVLSLFGAPQIRNAATLGGNIVNASPIADGLPFLFVTGATLELAAPQRRRKVEVRRFYRGYKDLDLRPGELLANVRIPLPASGELLKLYKVSKRRDLDISTFTAAIRLRLDGERIEEAHLAYGGVAPVVLDLPETAAYLLGKRWSEAVARRAGRIARDEISPISDVRGSADFRLQLAENILLKAFYESEEAPAAVPA